MEKKLETLRRADRHCDIEGLPPASQAARSLDQQLVAGTMPPAEAVRLLVNHHSRPVPRARVRSRLPAVLLTASSSAYFTAQTIGESFTLLM